MKRISQLIEFVKDVASSYLMDQSIDSERMESDFGKESAQEIVDRIKNSQERLKRARNAREIDKGKEQTWKKILKEINPTPKFNYFKIFSRVAAVFIGFIGIAYFLYINKPATIIQEHSIVNEEIVLKLSNGETQIITSNGQTKIIDQKGEVIGAQIGKKINYQNNSETISKELVYNELNVPYGKTFALILSDGTEVHLNAGTTLKYPVNFLNGQNRQVFLTGEAFFKVSKDIEHPFIVESNDLNIRVLGTSFNVSSYSENKNISTVLVEGAVRLYGKDELYSEEKSKLLQPGKKAEWDKENQKITIQKVNTSFYTSWIDGTLVIEKLRFPEIIKRLERHYNIKIINNNKELDNQVFTATFQVENIQEVLESFKANYSFKYIIEKDTITIN
ncbi:FecR family protein [Polaribacter sp. 20A6]|uniref:FecR family protein n=1 Tax=Polaribacter sp. 20A6 TaxID=2687289 RepID=UPI0013FDEB7B|nr:FecR domain-containing protein [Polaribacter sp. 20A6]